MSPAIDGDAFASASQTPSSHAPPTVAVPAASAAVSQCQYSRPTRPSHTVSNVSHAHSRRDPFRVDYGLLPFDDKDYDIVCTVTNHMLNINLSQWTPFLTEDARRQACIQYSGRCCNCGSTDHSLRWCPTTFTNMFSLLNPEFATHDTDGSMFEMWKGKMRRWRRRNPNRKHQGNGRRNASENGNSRYHNQHNSSGPPPAAHFAAAAPPHIRRIDFALDASLWDSPAIDALSDTFAAYADVFSFSKLDYGEHSLRPFEIKVPSGTQPIQSRPYRFNPVLSKQVDAILDSYLAAALIQHSASPWSSPLVCVPKKSGGISITVNYKKLNKVTEIPQIAIPRVDEVLDTLGGGSVFSVFDLFSRFTQSTILPDPIPLTAFCTPNGLYEWLRMPQGASGAPAWFVSVYLDHAIGSDDCPLHHVTTLAVFFARLRLHQLKLSPDKFRIGAARVDLLGHIIARDGVRPNDDRVAALTRMPTPTDIKQLRSLLGGLSYYRKFLPNMARLIRPITALLKKGAAFNFTSAMKDTVRALLAELAAPPILVFPDWDAVIDTTRSFRLHCDASTADLGATLEQEQPNGSI